MTIKIVASFTDAWIETCYGMCVTDIVSSRPSRTRGLKQKESQTRGNGIGSRPSRTRGLKLVLNVQAVREIRSRPSRTRGLKHRLRRPAADSPVASFTDAWIETQTDEPENPAAESRPSRTRGLKQADT